MYVKFVGVAGDTFWVKLPEADYRNKRDLQNVQFAFALSISENRCINIDPGGTPCNYKCHPNSIIKLLK